jgi:hypothetical protein
MPALPEIHLVSDPDDLLHPVTPQMIALFDHSADPREPYESLSFASAEGKALEVRDDPLNEFRNGSRLVLEGAIAPGLADPAASEKGL